MEGKNIIRIILATSVGIALIIATIQMTHNEEPAQRGIKQQIHLSYDCGEQCGSPIKITISEGDLICEDSKGINWICARDIKNG